MRKSPHSSSYRIGDRPQSVLSWGLSPIYISAKQARRIDEKTIEEYGIPSAILMERAGKAIAKEALHAVRKLAPKRTPVKVSIFCGKGNNGGDGLACARYLSSAGLAVGVYLLCDRKKLKGDAFYNMLALDKKITRFSEITSINRINGLQAAFKADIIIDAIFGTGFSGKPSLFYGSIIQRINASNACKISVDVPSGLDATTGIAGCPAIIADKTVTMGFDKTGFYKKNGPAHCGAIKVVDIGLRR